MALVAATQEDFYLVQLLNGIDDECDYVPVTIFGDNQGAIALSKNPVCRQRCKHDKTLNIILFDLQLVMGKITIEYCPTTEMVADMFAKPVAKFTLEKCMFFIFGVKDLN